MSHFDRSVESLRLTKLNISKAILGINFHVCERKEAVISYHGSLQNTFKGVLSACRNGWVVIVNLLRNIITIARIFVLIINDVIVIIKNVIHI